MDKDLIKLLEEAGFTEKEARVYLALLELGEGNVAQISKSTELKRPIIYVIIEGLLKRGYVSEVPSRKVNTYQAVDPSFILKKIKEVSRNFSEMLPMLRTLSNRGKKKPKIRYYDTTEGVLNVWENEMNTASDAFFIASYKKIEDYFPGKIEGWIKKAEKGIIKKGFRHLMADTLFERELVNEFAKVGQEVRIMPELKDANMDFTIYDNKLAITSLEEEPFIVIIESEALYESIKPIFELAWEKGRAL